MKDLQELRARLDAIDAQIVDLYKERMDIAREVGADKVKTGKKVFDPIREQAKLDQVTGLLEDGFYQKGIGELYAQLMSQSRKIQYQILIEEGKENKSAFTPVAELPVSPKEIVYQGVPGSYSQLATKKYFGDNAQIKNVRSFREAVAAVANQEADYSVLPIENSSAGMVSDVYDLLVQYEATIVGEVILPISHALVGVKGATLNSIKEVYSHPQALSQSSEYLEEHPDWKQLAIGNTAVAAKQIKAAGDITKAAICSATAASLYELEIIDRGINRNENNSTRFIVLAGKEIYKEDAKKVSVCFELPHVSGSLYRILSHVIFNDLNMTKIESRPIKDRTWEYRFYVDFEGNLQDAGVQNALLGIAEESKNLLILGNY
ncbi:chorismate mutase/prephenate dehydratase [Lachnospiraceae bacterium PF1-21]|uniref:prephenate dehydratase n=1 Tax=Ohessyouella blattaphilus TaxID=2949333 RepID=UPI002562FB5D|nr:prephenate dehydratase [Lachnospiraceae bacterium OttesenSCG-928-J05]